MTIGMDHHVDIIGVVERHRRALECRPHPGDAAPIGRQSYLAALCLKIVPVPKAGVDLRRDWRHRMGKYPG